MAPDEMNYVCCDPDELKVNRIKIEDTMKGRCRDQLLGYWTRNSVPNRYSIPVSLLTAALIPILSRLIREILIGI